MKNLLKILLLLLISFSFTASINYSYATTGNLNISREGGDSDRNDILKEFKKESDEFFGITKTGTEGIYYTMVVIARDLKNVFFVLATIFLMTIVVKVLFAENSEEEIEKFKKGIIWTTIGLVVMQSSFAFVKVLYDRDIGESLAFSFIDNIINPIIGFMEVLASVLFIGIAIFAFYKLITTNGDEEKAKSGKMTIVYALIGFITIKLAKVIVEGVYGKINCEDSWGLVEVNYTCLDKADTSAFAETMLNVLNWMNGFVGLLVVIMIIYTGGLVLLSGGDEDKLKKAKSSILYIAIGLALLAFNYLILTFFLLPDVPSGTI